MATRNRTPAAVNFGCARCGNALGDTYGTSTWCRACHKDAVYRGRLAKIGMTPESLAVLRKAQDGCCAVCRRSEHLFSRALHMDHNHDTNQPRALLCGRCNQVLGRVHDDALLLRALAAYLDGYQGD